MAAPGVVLALLAVHGLIAVVAGPLFRALGRRAFYVLALGPAALFTWCLAAAHDVVRRGLVHSETWRWAPSLHFEIGLRVDAFALLMLGIISGVGVLVLVYSASYFGGSKADRGPDHDPTPEETIAERVRKARIGRLLVVFAAAMAGVVASDNLLAIFLFWEATSVVSYLLIGTEDHSPSARAAALRAYVTTAAGGLAVLAGFVMLATKANSWSLAAIVADPPSGAVVTPAVVLVLLGAFTKSAQFPFHFWLAPAMAAPTPVSAYLHSATMVKAGVYLIARLALPFSDLGPWLPLVIGAGSITMILGAWRALSQNDLKVLLAHGTVSQLGFMVILVGMGNDATTSAGIVLLLAHALFKAALFMGVGAVDVGAGTRQIQALGTLWPAMRKTVTVLVVAAASMAGIPPLFGFVAKESALGSLLDTRTPGASVALVVVVVGSMLTVAYSARIVGGVLGRFPSDADMVRRAHEGSPGLYAPGLVLAALTIIVGLWPRAASVLVGNAAIALVHPTAPIPRHPDEDLALWHGFGTELALSAVVVGCGLGLWFGRRHVARLQQAVHRDVSAARLFDLTIARLLRASDLVIGRIQTGSLPFYLIVIFATSLVLPGIAFLRGGLPQLALVAFDDRRQVAVTALIVIAALGALTIRHRLGAVLCVGATGYGVAFMFMLAGAPDLALTQLLVETLSLIVFVLVMRHLPKRFAPDQTAFSVLPRAVLAIAVGVAVSLFTLYSFASRPDGTVPVSQEYVERAPDAGGHNVVNVILVEFRAFDTFGEIAVLTVAALGILGLVRATRRERGPAAPGAVPYRPSFVLDAAVHALFRTLILVSVILLLGGHDRPGGGFIGGLVAGCAFLLVYLAGGDSHLRRREPLAAEAFLGLGLVAAFVAGAVGWVCGGTFLESHSLRFDLPVMGTVKLSTQLLFEAGVYLVVIGVVMAILRSLGREEVHEL